VRVVSGLFSCATMTMPARPGADLLRRVGVGSLCGEQRVVLSSGQGMEVWCLGVPELRLDLMEAMAMWSLAVLHCL
jgi:hypothetical protein